MGWRRSRSDRETVLAVVIFVDHQDLATVKLLQDIE
jgi:hypothetical protein